MSPKTLSELIKSQLALLDEFEFLASGRELSLNEAREIQDLMSLSKKSIKQVEALIQENVTQRYYKAIFEQYRHKGKQSGSITYAPQEEGSELVVIEANIPKKVAWDHTKLMNVFGALDFDVASKYMKVEFKLSEANYGLIMDGPDFTEELQNQVNAARTITLGEPKVKMVLPDVK